MRRDDPTTHPHPYRFNSFIIPVFAAVAKRFANIRSVRVAKKNRSKVIFATVLPQLSLNNLPQPRRADNPFLRLLSRIAAKWR
jgi:hypothetical protein